jgi:hypothetical protein
MLEDDQKKIDEILNVRKQITMYMSEKMEPILSNKYVKEMDFVPTHPERTWFHFNRKETGKLSFAFEFYYDASKKNIFVYFHNKKKPFVIKEEKDLEKIFISLRKEMKKYMFSEMYES